MKVKTLVETKDLLLPVIGKVNAQAIIFKNKTCNPVLRFRRYIYYSFNAGITKFNTVENKVVKDAVYETAYAFNFPYLFKIGIDSYVLLFYYFHKTYTYGFYNFIEKYEFPRFAKIVFHLKYFVKILHHFIHTPGVRQNFLSKIEFYFFGITWIIKQLCQSH